MPSCFEVALCDPGRAEGVIPLSFGRGQAQPTDMPLEAGTCTVDYGICHRRVHVESVEHLERKP